MGRGRNEKFGYYLDIIQILFGCIDLVPVYKRV